MNNGDLEIDRDPGLGRSAGARAGTAHLRGFTRSDRPQCAGRVSFRDDELIPGLMIHPALGVGIEVPWEVRIPVKLNAGSGEGEHGFRRTRGRRTLMGERRSASTRARVSSALLGSAKSAS